MDLENRVPSKICPYDGRRCFRGFCGFLDSVGGVRVCRRHGNKGGFNLPRIIKPDYRRGVKSFA